MKKRLFQFTAQVLLLSMVYQLVFPVCTYALTTGPSQPEVQSFEPVGTTELVDMFTGDFNYNIPLLDVDGYPVNIFYHSGIGMEQESSWVGLGWNINPGEINRTVRGLPDDFNGEQISKYTSIKKETEVRVGVGGNFSIELLGKKSKALVAKIQLSGGLYVASNNYRGMSVGFNINATASFPKVGYGITPSVGVGLGIGSQTGADVDFNAGVAIQKTIAADAGGGLRIQGSTGFNSRTGLKDLFLSANPTTHLDKTNDHQGVQPKNIGMGVSARIPIGMQNYVPVITNRAYQDITQAQLKLGAEIFPTFLAPYFDVSIANTTFVPDGTRNGYGYMYLENSSEADILDFNRDKDGMYNETFRNLPAGSLAYDVYSVNGQGTGGMFRPFRNDVATIFDPHISPQPVSETKSVKVEIGIPGNLFEAGTDITEIRTKNEAGAWPGNRMEFSRELPGTLYEKVFFKQAGELTYNQQQDAPQVYNPKPQYVDEDLNTIRSDNNQSAGILPNRKGTARLLWNNSTLDRSSRATHFTMLTAQQAAVNEVALEQQIVSYENGTSGKFYDPKLTKTSRMADPARKDHISDITQTAPDGRRYVYGIPAINHAQREVTFAANEAAANLNNGTVTFSEGVENSRNNPMGRDEFYSSTVTPAYTHSYLLTALLSADYVDILGDGPTDDDLGTYVKYNYTLADNDYRWRAPYPNQSAQFSPGFWSDSKDGKGMYTVGSRQQWYVRSIETKNYVAEFYTSQRQDGRGATDKVIDTVESPIRNPAGLNTTKTASYSNKLDSIKLYNKHDRYLNKDNATAVKSVFFKYDYSLCKHTPNNLGGGDAGKLTLKQIFIRYGNSDKNLLSPYTFTYATRNPDYDLGAKDRWGNYKEIKNGIRNYEFPYTVQPDNSTEEDDLNGGLAGWELTDIKLPSGGKIHVDYESDDYGFVQDKRSMQMLLIEGVGPTKTMVHGNELYKSFPGGFAAINDYVYFKRRKLKENPNLSLRDNYLEGQDLLYYSFSIDVIGSGRFEHVNGYAKIDEVGYCDNNPASDYGYIKLKEDDAGGVVLHPASIYGINMARYYMPHLFYPGSSESTDLEKIWKGLIAACEEMGSIGTNPFIGFIKKQKARFLNIPGSWVRLQTPNLTKKGGGIRVKKLVLSDNWSQQSGNPREDVYGKAYDYTIEDKRYGTISSGVASYEPLIGGDENPFRKPVPYSADKGRLMPSVDLFQEEPMGESFFPGGSVGYSSVKVRSIHEAYGKSSLAEDEYLFYTQKDFPFVVEFTDKANRSPQDDRGLNHLRRESRVLQGYAIRLNDMHGKPKAVNNYITYKNAGVTRKEQVTGISYEYFRDDKDARILSNKVMALARQRGTMTNYELKEILLGQDIDMTVDSRFRETRVNSKTLELNCNVLALPLITLPIFTAFHADKEDVNTFRSMVSTKIIQQYGILKSSTRFDHGAITKTENLVFDAETGGTLLTRTNNEFGDPIYNRIHPAYLAYEGMRPAYTNTGFAETAEFLEVNDYGDGYLYTSNLDNYCDGDELLVSVRDGFASRTYKLWVLGKGIDTGRVGEPYSDPEPPVTAPPDTGYVTFYGRDRDDNDVYGCGLSFARIEVYPELSSTVIGNGYIGGKFAEVPSCGSPGTYTLKLEAGNYDYKIFTSTFPAGTSVGHFTVRNGECKAIGLLNCETDLPTHAIPTVPLPGGGTARCALKVAPRYKEKATSPGGMDIPVWPKYHTLYSQVNVTVLRSGRRNNLEQSVQQTSFTISPLAISGSTFTDLVSDATNLFSRSTNVLAVTANTFTDSAQLYNGFTNTLINEGYQLSRFNAYVLGLRGNFRPLATYAPRAPRSYTAAHSRLDGAFTVEQPMWLFTPTRASDPTKCYNKSDVFYANNLAGSLFWKRASVITAYDVLGNALEEQDAIGNYSSAQFGYNQALPVAVASNSRKRHFFTENFEDYAMLKPNVRTFLWTGKEQRSPFRDLFGTVVASVSGAGYTSEAAPVNPNAFSRYGQLFNIINLSPGGGVALTTEASHTGYYSLKTTSDQTYTWGVAEETADIAAFRFRPGQKYILNLWAKGVSTSLPNTAAFQTKVNSGVFTAMTTKVANMDGWYMLEAAIDLTAAAAGSTVTVKIPSGSYVDDIRSLPVSANMKSFVYDPMTFRLSAQLDENHMASFYEYDQEGLLIRTKKETTTGIITITESRSSHAKK